MKTVFVIAPFRAENGYDLHINILRAEEIAFNIAKRGFIPICVQTMYRNFDRTLNDEFWLECTKRILSLCDIAFFHASLHMSKGCKEEIALCRESEIPLIQLYQDLESWKVDQSD
jgi:hypothetical protein